MTTVTNESRIREIAYGIWEQEGRPIGRDWEHYFKAEQLVKEPVNGSSSPSKARSSAANTRQTGRARKTASKTSSTVRKSPAKKSGTKG